MSRLRYVVHPGWVGSRFVGYRELVGLYGLDPDECVCSDARPGLSWMGDRQWPRDAVHLHPRADGEYRS